MIFFTADLHLGDETVCTLRNRPYSSLTLMHDAIISNWNSKVEAKDEVYILGDLLGSDRERMLDLVSSLHGSKYLILGNHDELYRDNSKELDKVFVWRKDYAELDINDQKIIMFHYPIAEWNNCRRGAWMLHGHSHNNHNPKEGLIMDVGLDARSMQIQSLKNVADFMKDR